MTEKEAIRNAMIAVRRGPQVKRVEVGGHHWNFERARWDRLDRNAETGVVKGRISHKVHFADDHQIDYEITYMGRDPKGKPRKPIVEIRIQQPAWKQIAPKAVAAVVAYFSKNTTATAAADGVAKEILKPLHGNCGNVGEGLMGVIAAEMGKTVYLLGRSSIGAAGGVDS
jgi:hypothetical protein